MIQLTGPDDAAPGTTVCVTVTGASSSDLSVEITLDGEVLPHTVTQDPSGTFQICVNLPAKAEGILDVSVMSGTKPPIAEASIVVA